jgi:alkylation response protein AidB-like acyl-CoA dehydrogenase
VIEELESLEPFRAEVREWLRQNLPADWRQRMLGASESQYVEFQKSWFRIMRAGGYIAPHWPVQWGAI